jgi:NurA-like 5'-3' nuclease
MSHAYYGENRVSFFYINVGEEIGRVEIPQWVAMDNDKVNMVQTLILDQCIRGSGYPASLMEAHEQAVISTADRTFFLNILEESLESNGISFNTSQKDRTKRLRWL